MFLRNLEIKKNRFKTLTLKCYKTTFFIFSSLFTSEVKKHFPPYKMFLQFKWSIVLFMLELKKDECEQM